MSLAAVLLLALVGTATWWFAAGRWSEVPSVSGLDKASAEKSLAESDLSAQITSVHDNQVQAGKVIKTDPAAGASVLRGESVKLVVSLGKPTVPNVQPGISFEEAERAVLAAELQPQRDDGKSEYNDTVPKGKVVRLDPNAGSQLNIGAPVTIVLSKGPKPKPIPDVRGKTRDEAFDLLTEAGFEPFDAGKEFAPDIDVGKVTKTDPPANTELKDTDNKRVGVVISSAVTVPDLSQKTIGEAREILKALTLAAEPQGVGISESSRIFTQAPPPGSRVQEGSKVVLFALPGL